MCVLFTHYTNNWELLTKFFMNVKMQLDVKEADADS